MTPHHANGEPHEETLSQGGGLQLLLSGGDERSEPESQTKSPHPARRPHGQTEGAEAERGEAATASALPCLFVTTASEEGKPLLPGPRKKQADALTENIKWMAETFGKDHVGFLTLTLGDMDAGGRFRNLRDRKEAQKRFHSLLTNVIAKRYACGVVVTERHRNRGIHFHVAAVCTEDIRGTIDFEACFPPKDHFGKRVRKPDYSTANDAIKREWAFWRQTCKKYGFGRHQLQPMRENGEALGRYLGEYLSKDWEHRLPEDKGARCVRYFGHWSKTARSESKRRQVPPYGSRFGWMTPRARAWRELMKQICIVIKYKGFNLTEANIKEIIGAKWAWKMGRLFESVRFEVGDWQGEAVRVAIEEHNLKVQIRWLTGGGDPARSYWWHITEITLDHLRPSPEWIKQGKDLQLAKDCEEEILKRLKLLAKRKSAAIERQRMLDEVFDLLSHEPLKPISPAICAKPSVSG